MIGKIKKPIKIFQNISKTGIARRTPEYISKKMRNGNSVIALENDKFAGFCYMLFHS